MCLYFAYTFKNVCITDFILNNKRLGGFINLFSLNSFKTNDKIIIEYFQYFDYGWW